MNDDGKSSNLDRFDQLRDILALVHWPGTPLGAPEQWSECLCQLVSIIGRSHRPMLLAWGGEYTLLYNAACAELLGRRHPEALGSGLSKVFTDSAELAPALARIRAGSAVDFAAPQQAFRCTFTPVTSMAGEVVGCIATDFSVPTSDRGRELMAARAAPSMGLPATSELTRYRELFDRADQPMCILEVLAEGAEALDARIIDANACFEAQTGRTAPIGKTVLQLLPDVEGPWLRRFGEVASSGRARRFRQEAFGRVLEVFVCPVGAAHEVQPIAVLVRDVSELDRRTGDAAFLAELSRDFARLSGFQETLAAVAPKLEAHLGVDRVTFVEVDVQAKRAINLHEYHLPGLADARAPFELADFMSAAAVAELEAGRTVAVDTVEVDPRTVKQAAAWRRLEVGAMAQVPHHGGERLQFLLGVYRSDGSMWRDNELALLREVSARLWLRMERAQVADALLESQTRLRRTLRAAKIIAWEWDMEALRLTTFPEMSSEGWNVYFDADDLQEGFRRIHPEDKQRNRAVHLEAFRERRSYVSVYRAQQRDSDDWHWVEESGRPDDSSDGGNRFFGVLRDITRARQIELKFVQLAAESARQQRLHAAIMASTPDLLYVCDLEMCMTFANASLLSLLGRSLEETRGRHIAHLGPPAWEARRHEADVRRVVATREPLRGEFQFVGESGAQIFGYVLSPLFDDEGNLEGVVGTGRDITELKRVETALIQADERKDEFLALLSHELRNPLAAIQLSLYVMGEAQPGSGPARQAREIIERQANQLTRLVGDLLDVTRIARGKVRLQMSRVDVIELVRNTVIDQRALFDVAGLTLVFEPTETQLFVDGDADRLAQALGNLLQNAAKFTAPGGHAWVTVGQDAVGGGIALEVRDDGIGIDAQTLDTLFEPFVQSAAAIEQAAGGLGLGLALVKGFVELHGGAVQAASPGPGKGATFVVRLPASSREANVPAVSESPESSGVRSLIIEDNHDIAVVFRLMLEGAGHQVVVTNDGESGLATARRIQPDVIFCDLGLPGMDGYAVARAVRQDPALRAALLIAVSGYAQPADIAKTKAAGFDDHLAKPPDIARVKTLLAKRGGT